IRLTFPRKPLARSHARTSLLSPWKRWFCQPAFWLRGLNVSTSWAGNAVTRLRGRLPTQVSMGRPFAAATVTSCFFGAAGSGCAAFLFGFTFFGFALTERVLFFIVLPLAFLRAGSPAIFPSRKLGPVGPTRRLALRLAGSVGGDRRDI